jgi:hypothetical protein
MVVIFRVFYVCLSFFFLCLMIPGRWVGYVFLWRKIGDGEEHLVFDLLCFGLFFCFESSFITRLVHSESSMKPPSRNQNPFRCLESINCGGLTAVSVCLICF